MTKLGQYITIFIILSMICTICYGHIGGRVTQQETDPSSQIYCGRSLARALALLCFDEIDYEKRSDKGTMYGSLLSPYSRDQDTSMGLSWMSSNRAKSLALPSRGKRLISVVSECCDKPCGINELLTYC